MQELLLAVARGLVEDKEAVQVTVDPMREDGTVVYHLKVAEADMGRVIGKQGRIAKAIRVVMRAAAVRQGEKVIVEIDYDPQQSTLPHGKVLFLYQEEPYAKLSSRLQNRLYPWRARRNEGPAAV